MITYIILFLILVAFSFTDYVRFPEIYRKLLLIFGCVFVFLVFWAFASFRWETGTDWEPYYDTFNYFSEAHIINFEPGYIALIFFIKKYTSNYSVFLTVFSFLCLTLKFSFFFKYHKDFFFTLVLLFFCYYFADIFAVRQNLAISLTLFSTIFIIRKQPIFFFITVLLATSIHYSSMLYFFAYYIYWCKISDKKFYYIAAFCVAFGLIGIGGIILDIILKVLGVDGFIGAKINNYLNEDSGVANTTSSPVVMYLLGVIKRFIFIPLFTYVKNRSQQKFTNFQGYFNLYMIGNIIYFLFAKDLSVFSRASVPFLFFEIFLISYVLFYFKSAKKMMIPVFVIMMIFSWIRFNALVNSYYELYVPYNSIFDDRIERTNF